MRLLILIYNNSLEWILSWAKHSLCLRRKAVRFYKMNFQCSRLTPEPKGLHFICEASFSSLLTRLLSRCEYLKSHHATGSLGNSTTALYLRGWEAWWCAWAICSEVRAWPLVLGDADKEVTFKNYEFPERTFFSLVELPNYFKTNIMLRLNKYSSRKANYSKILIMSKNLKYKENESNNILKG